MRALLGAVVAVLLLSGCTSNENLLGQELFEHSCASCHSADGSGGIGVPIGPGSNTAITLTDDQIAGVIAVGPGRMPSFKDLSEAQVESLVVYVRSLQD